MAHCCVRSCGSDSKYSMMYEAEHDQKLSFHLFPSDSTRKKQWIKASRWKDITSTTYVCSAHFLPADFKRSLVGRRLLKKTAVPSVFPWTKTKKSRPSAKDTSGEKSSTTNEGWVAVRFDNDKSSKSSSHGSYDDRQPVAPPVVGLNNYDPRRVLTPVVVLRDHKEPVPPPVGIQDDHDLVAAPVGFHDYGPALPSHDSLTIEQKLTAALERIKLLEARRTKLTLEKFGLARFSGCPSSIKLYTGFPNYDQFKEFFTNIESHAKSMISFSQTQRKKFKTLNDYSCNLPLIDRLFMYLHKIRVGSLDQDLADKFNVTVPNVSRNTILFTDFLYCLLGAQRLWPTKPQVMKSMPFEFLMVYPDVRVVVDCVRLQLQCPLGIAMNSERQQASRRGSAISMKALIGMMPCGAISFISSLHSCSISDSHLTKVSGLLELLEPGDKVLVDKDFDIGTLLQRKGCDVVGPHTLEKKGEFTSRELENNERIGNAKMHVKRTMKRVREFHIFDSPLHPTLLGSASQMWTVCCLLCNFQGPITKDAPKTVNS